MLADTAFYDSSYLARFYLDDHGFELVRKHSATVRAITSAWHARAEVVAALHRACREKRMTPRSYLSALDQFSHDQMAGLFRWLPLTDAIQRRLERTYKSAGETVFLRAADALHLACAAEHGFREVFSNDRRFLDAAAMFGLEGVNFIPT